MNPNNPKFDLKLTNYRNFLKKSYQITPPTIIIGPNGVGKTNILETFSLLSTTNSFKKSKATNFINDQEKDFAKINLSTKNIKEEQEKELELRFLKNSSQVSKKAFLDQREVGLSGFIGNLSTTVFAPESLHIIKSGPKERRSFFNILLSQTDKDYLTSLIEYKKVKKERNNLLGLIAKGYGQKEELEFWDKQLIKLGAYITSKRLKFVGFINKKINKLYSHLLTSQRTLKVKYKTNIGGLKEKINLEKIEEVFKEKLNQRMDSDLKYQTTKTGPHRDDLLFLLSGQAIAGIGSQGEIRSLTFILKLIEREYLERQTKKEPLFLLDDPLSELDDQRARYLLKKAFAKPTIITALQEELRGLEDEIEGFQKIKVKQ